MGGYAASIGDYSLYLHDSFHDYIKDGEPKEYYEKRVAHAEFRVLLPGWYEHEYPWMGRQRNRKEYDINIPIMKLGRLEKLRKYYRFHYEGGLNTILWEEIKKLGVIVEGYVGLGVHYKDEDYEDVWKYYYLTSNIGEEPVKLQSPTEGVDILQHINNEEEHLWILKQGLEFYTEIRT